jgi:hypothetical protein
MPRYSRHGHGDSRKIKVTKPKGNDLVRQFIVQCNELSSKTQEDVEKFKSWGTTPLQPGRKLKPLKACTVDKYTEHIRRMMGWLVLTRGMLVSNIRLQDLVPTHKKAGANIGSEYIAWLSGKRGVHPETLLWVYRSLLQLAIFLHGSKSKAKVGGFLFSRHVMF